MTSDENRSGIHQFFAEMRRRHVVRFAIWYCAAAFVVLQLAEIVFPAFGIGENGLRMLVIGVVLAFPPSIILAWVFDITAEGIKRTEELPPDKRPGSLLPRLALLGITFFVVGGLALWLAGAMGSEQGMFAEPSGSDAGPARTAAFDPTEPIRSLAVLPLDNLSADTAQNYFTAGMHDELISELSQVSGLRVVSRTSVMQYAGTTKSIPVIGRELGVDALIEGSVLKAGDAVRITVQLVRAANDSSIWSNSYDRKLEDVLQLQSDVAHQIVTKILGQLSPQDESALRHASAQHVAPDAQDAYLRGKYAYQRGTRRGYEEALRHFQDAIRADSTFAPAYAGLAGARFLLTMERPSRDTTQLALAQREAAHALALDSQSVEAREVLTFIRKGIQTIAEGGPTDLPATTPRTAVTSRTGPVATSPRVPSLSSNVRVFRVPGMNDSVVVDLGSFDTTMVGALTQLGQRIEEQVRQSTSGTGRRSPHTSLMSSAWQLMSTGQYEAAAGLLRNVVQESPDNPVAWDMLVRAQVASGSLEGVVGAVRAWSRSDAPGAPDEAAADSLAAITRTEGMRGYWRWSLARLEARDRLGRGVPRVELATAHAALGDNDEALKLLAEAFSRGERGLFTLQFDPAWDGLRNDSRFVELAREARNLRYSPALHGGRAGGDRRR